MEFANESLTFNTYLNMYMLVGLDNDNSANGTPTNCGFHYSLSSDLVNWTQSAILLLRHTSLRQTHVRSRVREVLPARSPTPRSLIHDDPSINFETPGRTPYIVLHAI